jgi:MFS family permease
LQAYAAIFRHDAFRWFWLGATASAVGDSMTRVALTWYVFDTTGSPEALGWLAVAYTAPVLVGGLAAGVLLDRFDRRTVLLADSVIRGLVVTLVPLLAATDSLQLWHVYAVAAVYGALMMLSLAGGPTVVPSLVQADQLATANALEMLSFTLSGVLGPLVAGVLIPRIGAPNVVLFDACSYFAFALALTRLPSLPPVRAGMHRLQSVSLRDSVKLLVRNRVLLATTLMFMAFNIGGNGALSVWLPLLAQQVLGGGPELYGLLLGAVALGEVVGSLAAGGVRVRVPLGALICCSQALSGAALLLLLLGWGEVGAAFTGLLLFGLTSAPLTAWAQTLRMDIIPGHLRGRTFALLRTLMQGTAPLGGVLAGLLIPVVGIPLVIFGTALVTGAPGLLGLPSIKHADSSH